VVIIISLIIASNGNSAENNITWEMESWVCPECGFNVQGGNKCIYCGNEKLEKSNKTKI